MKILVINVSLRPESKVIFLPLGLAYVATAIKNHGYDLKILDIDANRYSKDYIEKYLTENKFDVICMGCIVTGYKYIKQLTAVIRKTSPQVKIVVGNSVASSIPEILLTKTEADIAVIGEGDVTVIEILEALKNSRKFSGVKGIYYKEKGKIFKTPAREPINDIDLIPFPEWELFDMDKYLDSCSTYGIPEPFPPGNYKKLRAFSISTARGCPFKCTFCYQVFRDVKYRHFSPKILVGEIKRLKAKYQINYFKFHDDLSLLSKKHAQEMAECLLQQKIDIFWVGSCRSNLFREDADIKLANLLKRSGCVGLTYSLESASPEILKSMNKKIDPDDFIKQSCILEKAGLNKWTSIVIGYPQETPETIKKTFDYCIKSNVYPSAGYLLPQPGSAIYSYALKEGFIKDEEDYLLKLGDRQDLRFNMTSMTDEELQANVMNNLKRCNAELKLGLPVSQLIKTTHYRGKK